MISIGENVTDLQMVYKTRGAVAASGPSSGRRLSVVNRRATRTVFQPELQKLEQKTCMVLRLMHASPLPYDDFLTLYVQYSTRHNETSTYTE